MRRREFIPLLGGVLAWPLAAHAQQPTKVIRIGFLDPDFASNQEVYNERFRAGLRALGYLEGKNIIIEFRYAERNFERLSALAAELVHLGVDVLVTYSNPGVLAAKQATTTIPIVMLISGDAVGAGLVASLNRPGGNVTGQTFFIPELNAKRLELLKELLPEIRRVAVLANPSNPVTLRVLPAMALTAASLELELQQFGATRSDELASAFLDMGKRRSQAVVVIDDAFLANPNTARAIVDLATAQRFPSIGFLELAEAGGLMSYGVDFFDISRDAAVFVHKIIKGAKPEQLPVEQPTKFKFVINLKTAKALGITIPLTLLARADEVIE
jgi:putative ABC transport system substrate-binding protein